MEFNIETLLKYFFRSIEEYKRLYAGGLLKNDKCKYINDVSIKRIPRDDFLIDAYKKLGWFLFDIGFDVIDASLSYTSFQLQLVEEIELYCAYALKAVNKDEVIAQRIREIQKKEILDNYEFRGFDEELLKLRNGELFLALIQIDAGHYFFSLQYLFIQFVSGYVDIVADFVLEGYKDAKTKAMRDINMRHEFVLKRITSKLPLVAARRTGDDSMKVARRAFVI